MAALIENSKVTAKLSTIVYLLLFLIPFVSQLVGNIVYRRIQSREIEAKQIEQDQKATKTLNILDRTVRRLEINEAKTRYLDQAVWGHAPDKQSLKASRDEEIEEINSRALGDEGLNFRGHYQKLYK